MFTQIGWLVPQLYTRSLCMTVYTPLYPTHSVYLRNVGVVVAVISAVDDRRQSVDDGLTCELGRQGSA